MGSEDSAAVSRHVIVTSTKSVGIQILLIFFLGPLGLFYSTIKGALIMLFGVPILFVLLVTLSSIGAATAGGNGVAALVALGSEFFLMMVVWWVGSFVWGVMAVNSYNKNLLRNGSIQ